MKKLTNILIGALLIVGSIGCGDRKTFHTKDYNGQDILFRSWKCVADMNLSIKMSVYLDGMQAGVRGTFDETIELDANGPRLLLITATVVIDNSSSSELIGKVVLHEVYDSASGGILESDDRIQNFTLSNGLLKIHNAIPDGTGGFSGVTCTSM
jgi:hypothetical protein